MARDNTTDTSVVTAHGVERAREQALAEFGRRLGRAIDKKRWRQSDLHRASGLGKDSISNYINGKSVPTRYSLDRLAAALGVSVHDLWPNYTGEAPIPNIQKWELDPANEDFAFVHINCRVRYTTALALMEVLKEDRLDAANTR